MSGEVDSLSENDVVGSGEEGRGNDEAYNSDLVS